MRKIITIGELGSIITGNTPPRSNLELYGHYTPFIKATDISETEKYTYNPEEYYSKEGHDKYVKSLIPKGATCVVTIGSIGKKMTMAHCDLFINQAMNAIIPNKNFDKEYVYYAVKNILPNIKMLDSGTASGRENVSKSAFSKMEILIEDNIVIQRRIAEILSRYDSLIENYQKQIKLLEEAAQRLYKEWFVDLRFPGYEKTKIVDGVPEGWKKRRVDEIFQIKYGRNLSTKLVTVKGNYPVYGANGIIGYYDKANCHEQVVLITSRGNGSGDVSITFHKESFVTNNSFIVTPLEQYSYCKLAFTYCFLKQANFRSVRTGAAQPQLTNQSIHTVEILVPLQQHIEAYCRLVSPAIELIVELKECVRCLIDARDRLLPRLMNGNIEV